VGIPNEMVRYHTEPLAIKEISGKQIQKMISYEYVLCLTAIGEVYSWGYNGNGVCGLGHYLRIVRTPQKIGLRNRIVDIVGGINHALFCTDM
jgi:alpha-tubulin suppressor-like RCC1 family protein